MKAKGGKPCPSASSFIPPTSSFHFWSGRRDSNSRPSAWKADALPTELHPLTNFGFRIAWKSPSRHNFLKPEIAFQNPKLPSLCRGQDSNLRRALARRVYSPVPLTTRPPLHAYVKWLLEPAKGLEPPTL